VFSRVTAIGRGYFRYDAIIAKEVEKGGDRGFMSTSELDKHKVDHLFLLIGENPLPNYVAARLLLNKGGTAYLVYTTGTQKLATRLETILNTEPIGLKAKRVPLNNGEADAYQIHKAICSELETIKDGKIGLNYTGGTKAMAVHAYRAVLSKEHPETVFSYLDPRKLEMCIDLEDPHRRRIKVKPEMLQVELVELFQIHRLELKANPTQEAQLPELAAALAKVFKDEDQKKQWDDWYGIFREQAREKKKNRDGDKWKSKTELAKLSISLEKLPPEIETEFKLEKLIGSDGKLSLQAVKEKGVFTEIEHFCKYLDGLWLSCFAFKL